MYGPIGEYFKQEKAIQKSVYYTLNCPVLFAILGRMVPTDQKIYVSNFEAANDPKYLAKNALINGMRDIFEPTKLSPS